MTASKFAANALNLEERCHLLKSAQGCQCLILSHKARILPKLHFSLVHFF